MKIFIAFMLLFFTNCLAPEAISATVNGNTAVVHSVISPVRKMSFKQKLEKVKSKINYFIVGVMLILIGLLVLSVGRGLPIPPPTGQFDLFTFSNREIIIVVGDFITATGVGMLIVRSLRFLREKVFK